MIHMLPHMLSVFASARYSKIPLVVSCSLLTASTVALQPRDAAAQSRSPVKDSVLEVEQNRQSAAGRSNSELLNLKPFRNSLRAPDPSQIRQDTRLPSLNPGGKPGMAEGRSANRDPVSSSTRAFGSFGIPFTSSRVQAGPGSSAVAPSSQAYLSSTYPYRAIGRLTFSQGYCSASLIRSGILLTAAHCIQSFGSGPSTNTNFQFIPAFWSNGSTVLSPYGTWFAKAILRPATWANGTDPGTDAARLNDLALIALAPQNGLFVGQRTGYLGYAWNNYSFISSTRAGMLSVAELHTLGYPFLLDSGKVMQMTSGPSYLTTVGTALQIQQGSSFTGGSSGGPWIANYLFAYPAFAGGARPGAAGAPNRVVGVTSWGSADPNNPKDNYSSRFGQNSVYPLANYGVYGARNIGALLNTLCNSRPAGSTTTFAQQGYCS
ncbi:MAG: trypsin-like serine peptidase [Rhodoluna sp.]